MTPDRKYFNEVMLPKFIKNYVKENDFVVDVGKPDKGWGYREIFEIVGAKYQTLDKKPELNPDILLDIETFWYNYKTWNKFRELADCIVCMGVIEQCDNPFKVIDGIYQTLKPNGYVLFGIISTHFSMKQDIDYLRFTPQGAHKLLSAFNILDFKVFTDNDKPSSIFAIVQKEA